MFQGVFEGLARLGKIFCFKIPPYNYFRGASYAIVENKILGCVD